MTKREAIRLRTELARVTQKLRKANQHVRDGFEDYGETDFLNGALDELTRVLHILNVKDE